MASRKLKCEVMYENIKNQSPPYTIVTLKFNRLLSDLELSGVKAVMNGEIR